MTLNPYLFLLLKRLLQLEAESKTGSKTIDSVIDYIIEKQGGKKADETNGGYIKKMWSKKVFDFPEFYLDIMSECVGTVADYNSWKEFSDIEGSHPYSKAAAKLTIKPYEKLDKSIRFLLTLMVEHAAIKMYLDVRNTPLPLPEFWLPIDFVVDGDIITIVNRLPEPPSIVEVLVNEQVLKSYQDNLNATGE